MAKMKLSPAVATLSGKLGNMVHRQLWGQHVVSKPSDFSDRGGAEPRRSDGGSDGEELARKTG
jgi:hypothetical protein